MKRKIFSPFCQENRACADKRNFMVVGEAGQGKTAAGFTILREALSKANCAERTANSIKGSRHD